MNKRLLLVVCCTLLLAALAVGTTAQEDRCRIDLGPIQSVLTNAHSAPDNNGALANLLEARAILESMINTCSSGGLNWCYPGQPWGDGRCNGHDLSQDEIDWFWTCGTYWAEYQHGLLEAVPEWCGHATDRDGDGYPDDVDQCPDQGGFVDNRGCPTCNTAVDADCDGTPNDYDQCPNHPDTIIPGFCGCAVPDSDGDGLEDCIDACPMPSDDPLSTGTVCWQGSDCEIVQRARDTDGDGCLDTWLMVSSSGCDASTPSC